MKIKKLLATICVCFVSLGLTACGGEEVIHANEDGTMKVFTEEEIPQGIFVKSKDGFSSVLNVPFDDFVWYTDYDNLIPEVKKDDSLILYTEEVVPETLNMWKLIDFGYSVGIKFEVDKDKPKVIKFPSSGDDNYCPLSPVGAYVVDNNLKGSTDNVMIKEVNGKEFKKTMLTSDGFMKGLTKDAMYKFWYYQGTVYKSMNIKADTHIFIADYNIGTSSYIELKDKVFEITLPSSIENGYWYIEDYGLFKFSGKDNDMILDPNVDNPIEVPDSTGPEEVIEPTLPQKNPDATTPAENPPAENPPAENPPAENPPAENPPAENPPAENPPAENPPAENPPA